MKTAYTETYKMSKTFNAPIDFVYAWCTDYQEDDLKMIGSKRIRRLHEKTKSRVIWTVEGVNPPAGTDPVRVVWLRPPHAWHLETCGDGSEIGDYELTALAKNKTRLDMTFTQTSLKKSDLGTKEEYVKDSLEHWDMYGTALEKDYARSLRS